MSIPYLKWMMVKQISHLLGIGRGKDVIVLGR